MKLNPSFFASALTLLVTLPGYAADRDATGRPAPRSDQRSPMNQAERLTHPTKASEILGKEVNNSQNEKLGKVDELAVDVASGRIAFVLVNSGGVLGVGGKTIAVPPRAFSYDAATKAMRLDVDKAKFQAAPAVETTRWDDYTQGNRLSETYRYFGQEPYRIDVRDEKSPTARLGHVEKASKVIGMAVINKENKKCGDVDNLIVDLPTGRIVHVIVSSGGFLGIGDALSAVPPTAFRKTPDGDSLLLDVSKEELTRAPSFKKTEWPNFGDPAYSANVYKSYGVDPYFTADADNTARNVRDRQENRLTPLDQGSSDADVQISRRIRKEILDREGLSLNARNVKIITVNGRVTLRGPVNTEAEKQALTEIANRIAQGANVDNQIEVKREP